MRWWLARTYSRGRKAGTPSPTSISSGSGGGFLPRFFAMTFASRRQ
jgi:hypothetical protein